ncbi:MAG: lysophospholipid acyltransferase family protein [Thermodesulfobacteriota bacterium]
MSLRLRLRAQMLASRLALPFLAPLAFLWVRLAGWRVRELSRSRRIVAALLREHPGPWLVCANHLTMIDSVILAYALFPLRVCMFGFGRVPWNLPEQMNFGRGLVLSTLCYLLKCVPVRRQGGRARLRDDLDKCLYLLKHKQNLLVFPEGTRSRSGHVDGANIAYGVGRFVANTPDCRVLCVYLRGDGQDTYSDFPRRNEQFSVAVSELRQDGRGSGLKAQRECAMGIVKLLAAMEEEYFATLGKRHSGDMPAPRKDAA